MGFKKTNQDSNFVFYDFDFVPKKLIPLPAMEAGFPDGYTVEGDDGKRAPIVFDFQGQRYQDYGFVFCTVPNDGWGDTCITTNTQLVATLASLFMRSQEDWDFDPWAADHFARKGITFPIMSLDEAQKFVAEHGIPRDGHKFLSEFL